MRRLAAAVLTVVALCCTAAGVQAGPLSDPPAAAIPPESQADALLRAAIEQLVQALGQALHDVPRYSVPELNENGDIILRRLNPPDTSPIERRPTVTPDEVAT